MQVIKTTTRSAAIYCLHPYLGGGPEAWSAQVARAGAMGFSHVLLVWPFSSSKDLFLSHDLQTIRGRDAAAALGELSEQCREQGLQLWMDLAIARADGEGPLVAMLDGCWAKPVMAAIDPRVIHHRTALRASFDDDGARGRLIAFWQKQIVAWQDIGVTGVRCHDAAAVDLAVWREILAPARKASPSFQALGWMPRAPRQLMLDAGDVFDVLPSSVAWWDGSDPALIEEYNALAPKARLLGFPQDPFSSGRIGDGRDPARRRTLAANMAAMMADGWLMPMGFEFGMEAPFSDAEAEDFAEASRSGVDLQPGILAINRAVSTSEPGERSMRLLDLDGRVTAVARGRKDRPSRLVLLNRDLINMAALDIEAASATVGTMPEGGHTPIALPPAEGALVALAARPPVSGAAIGDLAERERLENDRIAIEAVTPVVDGGRFPVKRSVGASVEVAADIFSDGHEVLAADVLWRPLDEEQWSRTPMRFVANDRWEARFPLLRVGRHVFAIEAWWGEFGTYRRDLIKKRDAGLDVTLEIAEGRLILEKFARHAVPSDRAVIEDHLQRLSASQEESAGVLLMDALRAAMERADPKPHATGSKTEYPVEADREGAAYASWYELFPRSITDDPTRHGTFRDVIGRLPAIKAMGFDVLYFPPIHPIGKTNRKGRNNTLTPADDDPGSPYAIGSPDGGHDAIHPELGSREDFRELVREAANHGLELALDFAIQCSPDHPWLTEHPDWFQWRPDGSMRYAENPPKKYQDIVNVDFYASDAIPGLWIALRDVVQSWVDDGVRLFRVDNPHTKPFPFWEWLIADIRSRDPGVLFLAEAFTRPKVMYRLGKVGFSQSYTYFTWRNTKAELTEYLTELNREPASDIFRPHFFVNTPDINPVFLQNSGRPGFLIRAALAATLSGLWGVYSGFELCEAAALPGKEEYLDSEKYEIRLRDWLAPGNIVAEITRLNLIRRNHRALQSHLGLSFYNASNDAVLYFGKRAEGSGDIVLVAVSLDPFRMQSAEIEVPLWEFGLPDQASVVVEDLMRGHRFDWRGKMQTIQLDPQELPFSIWRIASPESAAR